MAKCVCPKCKSDNIIPIVYGYPAKETMELADAGKVKLGGCQVYIDGCQIHTLQKLDWIEELLGNIQLA